MFEAVTGEPIATDEITRPILTRASLGPPLSFWVYLALVAVGVPGALAVLWGVEMAVSGLVSGPVLIGIGAYIVLCSTWFQRFVLYRIKVAPAVVVLGEGVSHVLYRGVGFATLGIGALFVLVEITG